MPTDTRDYYRNVHPVPGGMNCPNCGHDTLYQGTGFVSRRLYECSHCEKCYPVTNSMWLQERDQKLRASRYHEDETVSGKG